MKIERKSKDDFFFRQKVGTSKIKGRQNGEEGEKKWDKTK